MATGRGTLNKVMLLGRLGADPELKYTPNGTAVTNFSMATNQVWKDKSGTQQEKTEWHRIVAWQRLAEICGDLLKKGSLVYIEGKLQTRNWDDKQGNKRYMTEIVAETMQIIGAKGESSASTPSSPPDMADQPVEALESDGDLPSEDDDLPF